MPGRLQGNKPHSTDTDFRTEALVGFYNDAVDESGPKRAKLHRAMLKMIENGFWNPGDRLPTDLELTKKLPVSLATVQAAMQLLAEQEIVVRKKRDGTVVASEQHLSRDLIFFRFAEPGDDKVVPVEDVELSVEEIGEHGPWAGFLGPRDRYVKLSRTLTIDNAFLISSDFYFANPRLRVLLDLPPATLMGLAVRPMLQVRFGLPTTGYAWEVSFEEVADGVADILKVTPGQLCQRYDVGLFTLEDQPLGYHRFWVPPNRYRMLISP